MGSPIKIINRSIESTSMGHSFRSKSVELQEGVYSTYIIIYIYTYPIGSMVLVYMLTFGVY